MSARLTVLPRLLAAFALLALVSLAVAAGAQAATTPWGDQGHFADKPGELRSPEAGFGINPADGSAWVVDTQAVGTEGEEVFRIQKFENIGGTWKAVASRTFSLVETEAKGELIKREVEGVAFDTVKKRAYVLVAEERDKGPSKEAFAASELWAFSTETAGAKIEPAAETNGGLVVERTEETLKGGPVGQSKFAPDDAEKKQSLIEPGGLAVNPTNHQVVITGWVEGEVPAVWTISEKGTIEGAWEDTGKFFEKCGCLNSPVVTSAGKILALGASISEIYEIPATLSSSTPAKRVVWMPTIKHECEEIEQEQKEGKKVELCPFVEKLTQIDSGPEVGGQMNIGPEGDVYVHLKVPDAAEGGSLFGGVMIFNSALEEIGWTGGGSSATESRACAVNETGVGGAGAALVAGSGEHVFMFERGLPGSEQSKVLELGPGGSTAGCPKGSATPLTATAGGVPLESFPIADKIKLSTKLTQANALGTEWEFEPGVKETVAKRQQEAPVVEHEFAEPGEFTTVARIHADDLATPLVEASAKLKIVAPKIRGEAVSYEGTTTTLKAEVDPELSPTSCEFEYGPAETPFGSAGITKEPCPKVPGEGEAYVAESVKVGGLKAGTSYHFRLLAKAGKWKSNQAGTAVEPPVAGAPVAVTLAASGIGPHGATFNGTVNPEGHATTCKFEYGTTTSYGNEVPCASAPGSGKSPVAVSAAVSGLEASKTYHFRLVAESSVGPGRGSDLTLVTPEAPSAPAAETVAATGVTQTTATLLGSVNPHGEATTCRFEYGPSTSYGKEAPCSSAPGNGHSSVEVSAGISGLSPGTSYHYRLVAKNAIGEAPGADKELKTSPASTGCTSCGGGGGGGGGGGVLPFTEASPALKALGTTLTVSAAGAFGVKLSCPAGVTCLGTITIKTASAVASSVALSAKAKKAILTLATGTISISGNQVKVIALRLSTKAKKLLAKVHTIRAKATIAAHNPQGLKQTIAFGLTLKLAKKHH